VADDPLLELLDEARASDAGRGRGRERSLRRQAEEDASLVGALVDLAEHRSTVTLGTVDGAVHHGVVRAVGADFCVLGAERRSQTHVLVRTAAIVTVRPDPDERHAAASGDRPPPSGLRWLEVLATMAEDRQEVSIGTVDGGRVTGELRAVGRDVVTVALAGERRALCYVSASSMCDMAVLRSG